MRKHKWAILFLIIVCIILMLPVLIYRYHYPTISDDTPYHLQVVNQVAHGDLSDSATYSFYAHNLTGMSTQYRYAGPALVGLVVRIIHTNSYWSLYVFYYLALLAIVLSLWLFFTKLFGKTTGYIGVLFTLFGATPLLRYFYYAEIFDLTNLLIFGLMGILALIYWLRTNRFYYALISMMLFAISSMYHSSTGLEIYACVGFSLSCYIAYKCVKKAWEEVKRVGIYLTVFGVVCWSLMWYLCSESRNLLTSVLNGSSASVDFGINSHVPIYYFFTQDTSMIIVLFTALASYYLFRHRNILSQTARIGVGFLITTVVVFAVSIIMNRYEPARSAQDLGIILLIFASAVIGIVIDNTKNHLKFIGAKRTILFAILVVNVPVLYGWFQYHCAITPVDQKAIDLVETLNGSTYSVSTEIQPLIYELFIKDKRYVTTGGDYVIFRNKPETAATDPTNRYTTVQGNASVESDYASLPIVGEFAKGDLEIVVYDSRDNNNTK